MAAFGKKQKTSVAKLSEQQAGADATIVYVHPTLTYDPRNHGGAAAVQKSRVATDDAAKDGWKGTYDKDPEEQAKKDPNEWVDPNEGIDWDKRTGISRCGFSWDDAAAKRGISCNPKITDPALQCKPPKNTVMNKDSYWYMAKYSCYTDLPDTEEEVGVLNCRGSTAAQSDEWCQLFCNGIGTSCADSDYCICEGSGKLGIPSEVFNASAPIQPMPDNSSAKELPKETPALDALVEKHSKSQPSGLPACLWRPPKGCSNESQYQCVSGQHAGECSKTNWFESSHCDVSCVHTSLLTNAPYSPLWYPGPLAMEFGDNETQPKYKHSPEKISLSARGIDLSKSDVMMSDMCKSSDNHFVGVSMYSPHYKAKAERLLRSCARNGVCCKARLLPADAFGPDAPEGSEDFRFQTIASKPSFILGELEATKLPVVFLDVDLEFHSFPNLFVPGSWPNDGRDVAIFNFWGNETDRAHATTPNTGSGVVFFNQTRRSKNLLRAWAEAMAWKGNYQAPDDQVLDKLLKEGGWLRRVSAGWLPASYLRTMPSYYRGISPVVIDHDHGNAPGINGGHSEVKPELPPVESFELCDPDGWGREHEPAPRAWSAEEAAENAADGEPGAGAGAAEDEDAIQLPEGTCKSTAAEDTPGSTKEQIKGWNAWCDENCIPSAWGGLGPGACGESKGDFGRVGCQCKKGVEPVYKQTGLPVPGYKEALRDEEQQAAAEAAAPTTPEQPLGTPAVPAAQAVPEAPVVPEVPVEPAAAPAEQPATAPAVPAVPEPATPAEPTTTAVPESKCASANSGLTPDEKAMWSAWCADQCGPPNGNPENCKTLEQTGAAQCTCEE